MLLVSQIRDMFLLDKEGDSLDDTLAYFRINFIEQKIFDRLKKIDPNRFLQHWELSISSGTNEYDLPSGGVYNPLVDMPSEATFENLHGHKIFTLNEDGKITGELFETEWKSENEGFYFSGDKIVITPTPTADAKISVPYFPVLKTISENTDGLLLPEKFKKFYVEAYAELFSTQEEDYDISSVVEQKMNSILNRLEKEYPRKFSGTSKRKLSYSHIGL